MNYELTLPLQSSGKMEVTPQQSEILQKELFKMGYSWWFSREKIINHTHQHYLFWELADMSVSHGSIDFEFLDEDKLPLHLFDNHFKIEE